MADLVVFVTVKLKPNSIEAFLPLIRENATASVRDEPGCHVFDIIQPKDEADTIYLYEVYAGDQAFEAHKQTSHYEAFFKDAEGMVKSLTSIRGVRE